MLPYRLFILNAPPPNIKRSKITNKWNQEHQNSKKCIYFPIMFIFIVAPSLTAGKTSDEVILSVKKYCFFLQPCTLPLKYYTSPISFFNHSNV